MGKNQQLASLGELVAGSAGTCFTPHVITIEVGEDVAKKIMSFSQQGPRAVCILSANGVVTRVSLHQPATFGGTVTYEVIGSFVYGGSKAKNKSKTDQKQETSGSEHEHLPTGDNNNKQISNTMPNQNNQTFVMGGGDDQDQGSRWIVRGTPPLTST